MDAKEAFRGREKPLLNTRKEVIRRMRGMVCLKPWAIALLSLSLVGCVSAHKKLEEPLATHLPLERPPVPFRVGERLTYEVYYGLVFAGNATLVVQDIVEVCGRMTYHVVLTARTSPAFSKILRVNDRIETYIDAENFVPWKFAKVQEEGDYKHDETTILDQQNHLGHYRSNRTGYTKDYELPEGCQDTLSIFYLLRLLRYDVGQRIALKVMADERIWDATFEVKAVEKRTIYRGGTYEAFVVESDASFDAGALEKGQGRIWVSTDDRRLPVCVKTQLTFGNLTLAMVKADNIRENPQGDELNQESLRDRVE